MERSLVHFYFTFLLTCTANTPDTTETTENMFLVQIARGCEQTAYASETHTGMNLDSEVATLGKEALPPEVFSQSVHRELYMIK